MRKLWIGAALLGSVCVGFALVKRFFGSGDSMSGIDASGQDGFDAPEQRMSPARSEPKRSPEELQREARLAEAKDEVLARWPQLSAEQFDAASDDPAELATRIADRSGEPRDDVEAALAKLIAGASDKASFPVT
jgi:hypothetical protein